MENVTTIIPWYELAEQFFSQNALWIVPFLLVLLQFVMKLFIAEEASWHQTWKNFLHSPVDVGFLALSFAATLIISHPNNVNSLYPTSILYVVLLILSIVIWKVSPKHTTRGSMAVSGGLVFTNFIITGMMLTYSVTLVIRSFKWELLTSYFI